MISNKVTRNGIGSRTIQSLGLFKVKVFFSVLFLIDVRNNGTGNWWACSF